MSGHFCQKVSTNALYLTDLGLNTFREPLLGEEMLSLEEKCRRMYEQNRFVGQ